MKKSSSTTCVVFLSLAFAICKVSCLDNTYLKPTAGYNSSGYLNGIFADDWIPMTQGEALNYFTAKEGEYQFATFVMFYFLFLDFPKPLTYSIYFLKLIMAMFSQSVSW